ASPRFASAAAWVSPCASSGCDIMPRPAAGFHAAGRVRSIFFRGADTTRAAFHIEADANGQ
ncbi:MAG TPA: hypothetical protein VFJ18_00440, partial [Pararhizobium sp.]|nr:hypothetical protein [Pararhizobium sp.]